ncbi:hypothetical protein K227x_55280 [Rubripirellula lacrimiformis]|uniref:Secreted protein n=1 Tax=Rubripirellula lacrimiformis TaxID=1930273 RepID=A0A517NJ89_9BACT|nr:hypothetical protein [Rubripirellula lacrimiformis]QDT07103.1 hypothetical protein K227x_55280 [Rubripirellula lacrimiformis]
MNRLIAILLIPMFMLGHTLPHTHADGGASSSGDHAVRPHLHLGHSNPQHAAPHGHHGDHGHAHRPTQHESTSIDSNLPTGTGWVQQGSDHDSDAVYLSSLPAIRAIAADATSTACPIARSTDPHCPSPRRSNQRVQQAPPQRSASLPIYLLTLSIRL